MTERERQTRGEGGRTQLDETAKAGHVSGDLAERGHAESCRGRRYDLARAAAQQESDSGRGKRAGEKAQRERKLRRMGDDFVDAATSLDGLEAPGDDVGRDALKKPESLEVDVPLADRDQDRDVRRPRRRHPGSPSAGSGS